MISGPSRRIARVVPPTINGPITRLVGTVDIDGAGTKHPLPDVNPFILLDVATIPRTDLPPFGAHPHRGHSVVTVLLQGKMKSWDSFHPDDEPTIIEAPSSYYVHAGSGLFHDETTVVDDPDDPTQHVKLFQLWMTSKEEERTLPPSLQYDSNLEVEERWDDDESDGTATKPQSATIRYFLGGSKDGGGGKIKTPHPITVAHVTQYPQRTIKFPVDETHGGFLVHMEGTGRYGGGVIANVPNEVHVLDDSDDKGQQRCIEIENASSESNLSYLLCIGEKIADPWCKKLVANGAVFASTEAEAREIATKIEPRSREGLENGNFAPFGV